ncbi:MAG: hypothetical protein ACK48X_09435, partial [Planctomycetota bacterium]
EDGLGWQLKGNPERLLGLQLGSQSAETQTAEDQQQQAAGGSPAAIAAEVSFAGGCRRRVAEAGGHG